MNIFQRENEVKQDRDQYEQDHAGGRKMQLRCKSLLLAAKFPIEVQLRKVAIECLLNTVPIEYKQDQCDQDRSQYQSPLLTIRKLSWPQQRFISLEQGGLDQLVCSTGFFLRAIQAVSSTPASVIKITPSN